MPADLSRRPEDQKLSDKKCPKMVHKGDVWSGRYEACGKPVKRHGLCGVHARSVDIQEQRRQEWAAQDEKRAELAALAERLSALVGAGFGYTSHFVTADAGVARALIALLESEAHHAPR